MMEKFIRSRLEPVSRRRQWQALAWNLALSWTAAALLGAAFLLLQRETGWYSLFTMPALGALAAGLSVVAVLRISGRAPDYRALAQDIERKHPELQGLLLTAVQQDVPAGENPGYLQYRVLQQAMERSRESDWRNLVPRWRLAAAAAGGLAGLALLVGTLAQLRIGARAGSAAGALIASSGLTVTPGDASLERGSSLIVLARFGGALPANVDLVVHASGQVPRKIPLVKSLADPVFGGSVTDVAGDFTYSLSYAGRTTRDYKVSVFEHPRLERADASLTFPRYTGEAPKRIENTRRISAVEGTDLALALQLNKPVNRAVLVAHDAKKTVLPLETTAGKAVALLPRLTLAASQTYDLQLTDADGRSNTGVTSFVIEVQPNRPPELHLNSPRGDLRPSALEEVTFDGTVWDDFGSPAYGLSYTRAGGETKTIELGHAVPAKEKRAFTYTLPLESLGVQPDELISWYVWADDVGPDGKPRRTNGDLYFAEVRPFDEIFRESQMPSSDEQQQGGQQGQGNQNRKLTELEKQIINATWKLQRNPTDAKYPADTGVVHDSQQEALTQAAGSQEKTEDPHTKALWTAVTQDMTRALTQLKDAARSPAPLGAALTAEQSAYQALLKLQARETQVARSRGRGGQGGGQQGNQRELDQLDLTQEQNRYETQKQASAAETPQRHEQLQVMSRLQDLARRQQDVNDRLKELQTALQEARTEPERQDLQRQLKRLQEEQQQMVADVDELRQRMDRPENQSSMSGQRQQLDQTRDDVQRAADATGQGSVAQALAAGTRAQRQLQDMREELRKETSSQFADDLRDMRGAARELADKEDEINRKLGALDEDKARKSLSDTPDRQALADELGHQKERMKDLVDRAKTVSQQAENTEPLLAEKIYDSLRKVGQDDDATAKEFQQELLRNGLLTRDLNDQLSDPNATEGAKALDLTSEMLRQGYLAQAGEAEQRARAGIGELKDGMERAASSVLGDDTEALRLARSELDTVTDQLQREAAQAQAQARNAPADPSRGGRPDAGGTPGNARTAQADAAATDARSTGPNNAEPPAGPPGTDAAQSGRPGQQANSGPQPGKPQSGEAGGARGGDRPAASDIAQAGDAQGNGASPGEAASGGGRAGGARAGGARGPNGGGRGGLNNGQRLAGGNPLDLETVIHGGIAEGPRAGGPLTGGDFTGWADQLRDVEQMVDSPELRNAVAAARERARLLRQDYKRDLKRPDWDVVQKEVLKPLVEVRSRISDELARRESKDSLVPIDRDPVPNRYAESVRRYYEELGRDK